MLFGFEARERVNNGGIGRGKLLCGMQSFIRFGKQVEIERLKAAVELEIGRIGELFAGMAQGSERVVRMVVAAAGHSEFCGGGNFSFTGGSMMRVLREDGFKAIHRFGVAVLREQYLAYGQVGRDGVGVCRESMSEGLAGFIGLVKLKQSIAKQNGSGGVVGVLRNVGAKKRGSFAGFVLQAKMVGASKNRVGLSVSCSLQTDEDQWEEKTVKVQTMHPIPLWRRNEPAIE
ncbi:MAG TPA: hypothetical protein VHX20_06490 [Terracidiphilus sp.]|nr:hypothetical protein [Terracidiphilus sp.]